MRPSTKIDEEGRIMSILITIHCFIPIYEKGTFEPIFSSDGKKTIDRLLGSGQLKEGDIRVSVEEFYDEQGQVVTSVRELTSHNFGGGFGHNAIGSFYLNGLHIDISGHLIELHGLTYEIPFSEITETIEINAQGNAKLLIKDQFGNIDKLITDEELKKVVNEVLDKA